MNILKILCLITLNSILYSNCVTFNLDLSNFNLPNGEWIAKVNGSWNNWGSGIALNDLGDNLHSITNCNFENGNYQFVYVITGDFDQWSNWGEIGRPPLGSSCDYNPNDTYANYGFEVQNNSINLEIHRWNCCGLFECSDWEGCNVGAIKSDSSYLYGRFEVRMKSADGNGIVSSFFTYNTNWDSDLGNLNWNEIDIEMTGNRDSSVQFTTHHPGEPNSWSYGDIIEVDFNPHNEFHNYAFEWTPTYIKWFIDDQEVYQQSESIVDDLNLSQNIMMNIWPAIWEDWVGEWDNEDTPKHSYYDFVKFYTYSPNNGNYGTYNNFLFSWIDNFDNFDNNLWDDNSSGTFNGNFCSFTPLNTNIYNGHLILSLTDTNENINCNEVTGDINEDNILNVLDLVYIVDIVLSDSTSNLSICQKLASDLDFSNNLNILDLVISTDFILN